MEEQQHNIDDIFRQSLGDYREAPPPAAWDALEQRLDGDARKPKPFFRWPWIALLLLLFAGSTWYAMNRDNNQPKSLVAGRASSSSVSSSHPSSGGDASLHPITQKNKAGQAPAKAANTAPASEGVNARPVSHPAGNGRTVNQQHNRAPMHRNAHPYATRMHSTPYKKRRASYSEKLNADLPKADDQTGNKSGEARAVVAVSNRRHEKNPDGPLAADKHKDINNIGEKHSLPDANNRPAIKKQEEIPAESIAGKRRKQRENPQSGAGSGNGKEAGTTPAGSAKSRAPIEDQDQQDGGNSPAAGIVPAEVKDIKVSVKERAQAIKHPAESRSIKEKQAVQPVSGRRNNRTAQAGKKSAVPKALTEPDRPAKKMPANRQQQSAGTLSTAKGPVAPVQNTEQAMPEASTGVKSAVENTTGSQDNNYRQTEDSDTDADGDEESQAAVTDGGGSASSGPPKSRKRHALPPPLSLAVLGGYETGLQKPAPGRGVAGLILAVGLNKGFSLGVQPAYRFGTVASQQLFGAQVFGAVSPVQVDSSFTADTLAGRTNRYLITQSYDSVRTPSVSAGGKIWEVELPLLLRYESPGGSWHIYGGPSFNFGGRIATTTSGTLQTFTVLRSDSIVRFNRTVPGDTFSNYFGTPALEPISNYTPPKTENPATMRIGYVLGFGYQWRGLMLDASLHQQLTGYRNIPSALQKIYGPYLRITLGYRIFGPRRMKEQSTDERKLIQRL